MSCCDVSASEAKGEGHNPRDFSNLLLMEDVDRVIEQMDSEIQRIKEKMELELQRVLEQERVLYAHRNTLIPMSKLPPEVLRMIFRQSQWTAPWQRLNPAFAQVCSQWRTLALNDPFLWRTPYFYRQKHLSETLNRAKDLPLIIRHDCYVQEDTFEAVKTTLENKTVEHLELLFSGRSDRQVGTISRLVFEKSRLSLKFLALENGANKPVALLRSGREGNSLPFPLLRCLRLVNCTLPLELHCFPNLTTLELCCKCSQQLVDQAIHMNLASIVLVLRNCPKLERLELSKVIKDPNVSPPEQGVIEHPPENFRMQHLKYLGLRDRSSLLLPLIYILELPALSKLEITSSYSDSFDDVRALLQSVKDWISSTFATNSDVRAFVYQPTNVGIHKREPTLREATLKYEATFDSFSLQLAIKVVTARGFNELCRQVPLFFISPESVEKVVIDTTGLSIPLRGVWGHMAPFVSVVEIEAIRPAPRERLLETIRPLASSTKATSKHALPFPSLQRLCITSINLSVLLSMSNGEEITWLGYLALIAKERKEHGSPISVTLRRCTSTIPAIEVFKAFGVDAYVHVYDETIHNYNPNSPYTQKDVLPSMRQATKDA